MGGGACWKTEKKANVVPVSSIDSYPDAEEDIEAAGLNGEYQKYKLIEKRQYNHDCIIFKFALHSDDASLGLPVGKHMMLKWEDTDQDLAIIRAYTPISNDTQVGYFELLIKIYSDGHMTQILNKLEVNEHLQCKGPSGKIMYDQPSHFKITDGIDKFRELNVSKIGMLAGGTGLTPMYQLLRCIDENREKDQTKVSLIYANKTENDILLKSELDAMCEHNENIKIYYTISTIASEDEWKGGIGHIDEDMIVNNIFDPSEDVAVLFCGPVRFNKAMKKLLNQIGYPKSNVLKF